MTTSTPGDCFTPLVGSSPERRALDAHRAVRFDGLLQLIEEVQRRRSIEEVARAVAGRWKHCSSVQHWRLLCVFQQRCALVVAQGQAVEVSELELDQLQDFDALMWTRRLPRHLSAQGLEAERASLPSELADLRGVGLSILPVQQGLATIGIVSVLSFEKPFDNLDRKFNALVASAMATRMVAILTEQSLTRDLMQAQQQLLEQRQAAIMGRLVNGVAHELNTPLGVQIACCDALAAMVADSGSAQEFAQDIQETVVLIDQQARRAAKMVQRLKQISAATAPSAPLATPLIEELELIAQGYPDLDIRCACPVGLSLILDRNALATVLGELLDNARAHGRAANGETSLLLSATESATEIRISVSDSGAGFVTEQVEHFFDPFFTSKLNQGHIGIGAYIAKSVARDALGASLALQTATSGTTVSLHLPKP